jgi:hypothetical protein
VIYYKIRSKKDPTLFRKANGTWNKSGKVYDTLGKLRSTLTLCVNRYSVERNQVSDWDIVEYRVEVSAVKDVHEVMDPRRIVELMSR